MTETESTTGPQNTPELIDYLAQQRARLDQIAAAHASRVVPLAKRTGLDVDTTGMIILSLAVELVDADDQLAAITRAVVAVIDSNRRRADVVTTAADLLDPGQIYPTAVEVLAADDARRKAAGQ